MTVLSSCLPASRWILLSLMGLLPCGLTLAQTPIQSFGPEGKSQFALEAMGIRGLGLGDFDRDGRLDVFGASETATSFTYFGDGHTDFRKKRVTVPNGLLTHAVLVADLDGDKRLDLVLATANNGQAATGQTRMLRGDGLGNFVDVTTTHMPKDKDSTNDIALGDVNGDGYLDLVLANGSLDGKTGQQNRLYLNNGKGVFTEATKTLMPIDADITQTLTLGDLEGDGDLDLVLVNGRHRLAGSLGQQNRLYLNDGKGRFTDKTSLRISFFFGLVPLPAVADIDRDGDLDIIKGQSSPP